MKNDYYIFPIWQEDSTCTVLLSNKWLSPISPVGSIKKSYYPEINYILSTQSAYTVGG